MLFEQFESCLMAKTLAYISRYRYRYRYLDIQKPETSVLHPIAADLMASIQSRYESDIELGALIVPPAESNDRCIQYAADYRGGFPLKDFHWKTVTNKQLIMTEDCATPETQSARIVS